MVEGQMWFEDPPVLWHGSTSNLHPRGVNRDVVHDGVNGFWAYTNEEWVEKLSLLIEDPSLRQKMGMLGRELVKESFSVQGCASQFYGVLEEVAQRGI
jgi:glycosyltransferase involved in cell wall biosynthesis